MELLQLRYFYATVQRGSFAKTAQLYQVPASSVSASVKRLEKELGVSLFDRSANRLCVSAQGKQFSLQVGEALQALDDAVLQITASPPQKTEIRVLVHARGGWIADLIIAYRKIHPQVYFHVSNTRDVDLEQVDIVIDQEHERYGGLEKFVLSAETICVKASKNSALVGKKLYFKDLSEQTFVVNDKESNMHALLMRTAAKAGFKPHIAVETNDKRHVLQYAAGGIGLMLGSRRALQEDGERELAALDVVDFHAQQKVLVYHHPVGTQSIPVKQFCDFLMERRLCK